MAPFKKYKTIIADLTKEDYLHVNQREGKVKASVKTYLFQDKDTNLFINIIPSLSLTGYGSTKEKAREMLKNSIDNFNQFLVDLSLPKMDTELRKLGWKKSRLRNKEYSKAYIDGDGNLKNFNAIENTIETKILQLA